MSVGRFLQQAAAGAGEAVYVDDLFSTYLYEGDDTSNRTIENGIDLAGEGGMVWIKARKLGNESSIPHVIVDTESAGSGANPYQGATNSSSAYYTASNQFRSFASNGFIVSEGKETNGSGSVGFEKTYASWTFRKQPGFFDVVTWTGTGSGSITVSHNLGSAPGTILVKATNAAQEWFVYHRSLGATKFLHLSTVGAAQTQTGAWNDTEPTSTEFTGGSYLDVNGRTYVAYLFAHDAQDFGTDSDESIIKCGSYTGTGAAGNEIDLGFEPQWIMFKRTNSSSDWVIFDSMRGLTTSGNNGDRFLYPNQTTAEGGLEQIAVTATGFVTEGSWGEVNASGGNYIYVAIRRPHKPAEEFAATDLFDVIARSGTGSATTIDDIGFPPDAFLTKRRNDTQHWPFSARLTGNNYLYASDTNAQGTGKHIDGTDGWGYQDEVAVTADADVNASGGTYINYFLKRAPGFFDVVAYTGQGTTTTVNHNLGVAPELWIIKNRDQADGWAVYTTLPVYPDPVTYDVGWSQLQTTNAFSNNGQTAPTDTAFSILNSGFLGTSGEDYIAYLFATVPGISKVGSYSGTGATQTIDCGFSSGARFVLIKSTTYTGGAWFVFDTERGITTTAPTSPFVTLNSTSAESSSSVIEPDSTGFKIIATGNGTNGSGQDYIFLAIA